MLRKVSRPINRPVFPAFFLTSALPGRFLVFFYFTVGGKHSGRSWIFILCG